MAAKRRLQAAVASCEQTRAALHAVAEQVTAAKADSVRLLLQRISLAEEVKQARATLQSNRCTRLLAGLPCLAVA